MGESTTYPIPTNNSCLIPNIVIQFVYIQNNIYPFVKMHCSWRINDTVALKNIFSTSKWMEAIPLSEMSAVACAKALTFAWISCLRCPKRSLLIMGRNLLPTYGFNFVKCLTFHTNKQQPVTAPFERRSRKTAPPPHGRASRMRRHGNMVRGVTLCAPRTQSTAEGRHWSFPG